MEFHANNPTAPNKPVAVMMVYNNTPAAVMALKKSGIKTPADLNGKSSARRCSTPGAGLPDLRQGEQHLGAVSGQHGPAAARDHARARRRRRDHGLLVHLAAQPRGARRQRPTTSSPLPPQYGVKLYGNAIIVGESS